MVKNQKSLSEEDKKYWHKRKEDVFWSYVWKYPHPKFANHSLEVDAFHINNSFPHFELEEMKLFEMDEETRKDTKRFEKFIKQENNFKKCLNKYFFTLLAHTPSEKESQSLNFQKINTLVIPKEKKEEIENVLKQFNLLKFRDYIFYLIAKIQDVYDEEISFYQNKEEQKQVRQFQKECNKLIEVIKKRDDCQNDGKISPSRLAKITFGYAKDKNITINDPVLLLTIMGAIAPAYYEEKYEKWIKHISSFPELINTESHLKNKFKKNIAKALQKFFRKETKLKSTASWKLIAHIFNFSLIKIAQRKFVDIDTDADAFRQWFNR